jgi:hypothetical protein
VSRDRTGGTGCPREHRPSRPRRVRERRH